MRMFIDYHHLAGARSFLILFCEKLGYEVFFPDKEFCNIYTGQDSWGVMHPGHWDDMRLSPYRSTWPTHGQISFEDFKNTKFDVLMATRSTSGPIIMDLRERFHRNSRILAQAGNEGTVYDWSCIKNLMASDTFTYEMVPKDVHKILISQPLGWHYGKEFIPVRPENQFNIAMYINSFAGMTRRGVFKHNFSDGRCPYCSSSTQGVQYVNLVRFYQEVSGYLNDHKFSVYGSENESLGGVFLNEVDLLSALAVNPITWHTKPHEGFGLALCQSLISGRPVLVQKGFYQHRFASRYLIPDTTSFELDLTDPKGSADKIRWITEDLGYLQSLCFKCWSVCRELFDIDFDVMRMRRFMENLV